MSISKVTRNIREGGPRVLRGPLPYELSQKYLIEKDKDEEVSGLAPHCPGSFSLGKGQVDEADLFLVAPGPEAPGGEGQAWIGDVMG